MRLTTHDQRERQHRRCLLQRQRGVIDHRWEQGKQIRRGAGHLDTPKHLQPDPKYHDHGHRDEQAVECQDQDQVGAEQVVDPTEQLLPAVIEPELPVDVAGCILGLGDGPGTGIVLGRVSRELLDRAFDKQQTGNQGQAGQDRDHGQLPFDPDLFVGCQRDGWTVAGTGHRVHSPSRSPRHSCQLSSRAGSRSSMSSNDRATKSTALVHCQVSPEDRRADRQSAVPGSWLAK